MVNVKEIIYKGLIPVISPKTAPSPRSFIYEYRGFLKGLALIARNEEGFSYFPSKVAPSDKENENFIPEASEITSTLEIPTYFVLYTHFDPFMWKNYKTVRANNETPEGFICPINKEYFGYLMKLITELCEYKPHGVILHLFGFINVEYCFCRDCREALSRDEKIPADIPFSAIKSDKEMYERWLRWRSNNIMSILSELSKNVHERNVKLYLAVEIDPFFDWIGGLFENFGYRMEEFIDVLDGLILHISPWEGLIPEEGTDEYNQLVKAMEELERLKARGLDISIMFWRPDMSEFSTIVSLKDKFGIENVFLSTESPTRYGHWRETKIAYRL